MVRRPSADEIAPVRVRIESRSVSVRGPTSPMLLVYGFLVLMALGTAALMLPISNTGSEFTPFTQALFTCVSAVTVTGLTVVDTAEAWSRFGQVVVLGLFFLGGLGFLTGAAFFSVIIGQRLSLANQLIVREGMGGGELGTIASMVRTFVVVAVGIQALGALLLFLRWYVFGSMWDGISLPDAVWHSVFHAVSAFNNAGFDVIPDELGGASVAPFRHDFPVLAIIGALIVIGGIGFTVLRDIVAARSPGKLRLETKLILIGTLTLIPIGAGIFFFSERDNPELTFNTSVGDKVGDAFFHSISARTAGFSTLDYELTSQGGDISTELLMFIGGASASTAGGIKINTFMVIVFAVLAVFRGRSNVSALGREIPLGNVRRALVITIFAAFSMVCFMYLLLTVQDTLPFRAALFEVISAFSTVGLSKGITGDLNDPARVILVMAMFVGRLGPLTMALLMTGRAAPERIRMAQEEVRIG